MSERRIGKVISVDSFRIVIQLDENLKSLLKSGFNDIYEIARINSYIIIPVGSDLVVGLITKVKVQEEAELDSTRAAIILPKSDRFLVATMIGTIANSNEGSDYFQGVYEFPILENPVWYVTKEDLDKIFDVKNTTINYDKDYFLPIGESPAFKDYQIKINPDKFFGKHAAILGNTGSGKSCTVATIIQSLFEFDYNSATKSSEEEGIKNDNKLKSAHIIIFDTNGEYKRSIIGDENKHKYEDKELVNCFHIDRDGLKVPYWFMNYEDFEFLFEPSSKTQTPILKRAIGLAKNKNTNLDSKKLTPFIESGILSLLQITPDELKKKKCRSNFGNWEYKSDNEILKLSEAIHDDNDEQIKKIKDKILKIGGDVDISTENISITELKKLYGEYQTSQTKTDIAFEKNIDLPIWFSFKELITTYLDEAINQEDNSGNRIRESLSTLRLRLSTFLNDVRLSFPLLLNEDIDIKNGLQKFLSYIVGDFCKIYDSEKNSIFDNYVKSTFKDADKLKQCNQVTIIDMSLLPFEVLETITALIGRLILEFLYRIEDNKRGEYPVVLVLEEAQNYIPEKDKGEKISISKKVFERIAREGRKFGLSLLISSQRPSEVSKTVLSQCNSYIIHRIQNPEDQRYIRQLVSSATEDILQQLPVLPQQHAIILGDGVRTPVQVKLRQANPTPDSNNPKIIENWLKKPQENFPDYKNITDSWLKGKKNIQNKNQEENENNNSNQNEDS